MGTTQPIRDKRDIQRLKDYFVDRKCMRDYAMITMAVNTSLRIGDLLKLKWGDVFVEESKEFRAHIVVTEQKTKKVNIVPINQEARAALNKLRETLDSIESGQYIFQSRCGYNKPISRVWAFQIIKHASQELKLEGKISCHSLRKTFGYHAWKKGVPPALIMRIYNHSSLEITKRYLSIEQDDIDEVFLELNL